MEQGEILNQLKKIVVEHAPLFIVPPSANACWFDGNMCPYGFPNGKFQDRPKQICHLGTGGCNRSITLEENGDDFFGDYEDKIKQRLDTAVTKNKVSLSSELEVIAKEQCEDKSPEQQTLELAADIIKEQHDKDILRVDDI